MTILIIEGPDLTGKTTAIERIGKRFKKGFLVKNLYKPTEADDQLIWAQYWSMINMFCSREFAIFDRFYPSQAVYSYLRGSEDMFHPEIQAIEKFLQPEAIYVQLEIPWEETVKRYNDRWDEHVDLDDLKLITMRYEAFYKRCPLKKILINTMEPGWLDKLEDFVNGKRD